ncbi:Uncharacterised protein [Staphylococcus aureus]|nr:Uncharacterised protein [Staphylococcus aureus]
MTRPFSSASRPWISFVCNILCVVVCGALAANIRGESDAVLAFDNVKVAVRIGFCVEACCVSTSRVSFTAVETAVDGLLDGALDVTLLFISSAVPCADADTLVAASSP